jgi:hypothetical protein
MFKKKKNLLLKTFISFGLFLFFLTSYFSFFVGIEKVSAADETGYGSGYGTNISDPGGILKGVKCAGNQAVCGLCDFIQVFANISELILAASGVVGFLLFVYAGLLFLLVPYKPDYVNKAKSTMVAVVIGLAIVFGAYTIVSFTLKTIGYKGVWSVCSETASQTN